jgi:hypothetical protein
LGSPGDRTVGAPIERVGERAVVRRCQPLAGQPRRTGSAMTYASCRPVPLLAPVTELDQAPDRFVELLDCLADLLVETGNQRTEIAARCDCADRRVQEAVERVTELELSLRTVSGEVAAVHQLLQRVQLV